MLTGRQTQKQVDSQTYRRGYHSTPLEARKIQDEMQDVKMASAYLKFSVILQLLLCPGKVLTQLRCGGNFF